MLLLDEPLGALDLKLREQMQVELKEIQRQVGITFVFVTHDQEEALTMSDRIAVFERGPDRAGRRRRPRSTSGPPRRSSPASSGRRTCSREPRPSPCSAAAAPGRSARRRSASSARRDEPAAEEHSALGTVREVVYAGPVTRFIVDLDAGGSLAAMQQNLTTSSMDVLHYRDARVRLVWRGSTSTAWTTVPWAGPPPPRTHEGGEDRHASA